MRLKTIFRYQMLIAGIALVVIVFVSVYDVLLTAITGVPLRGVYDVVQAAQVVVIFLVLPEVFRTSGNITVDLIDIIGSKKILNGIKKLASFASAAFLLTVMISAYPVARDALLFNEHMVDSGIPHVLLWIPLIYGLALSTIASISQSNEISRSLEADEVAK